MCQPCPCTGRQPCPCTAHLEGDGYDEWAESLRSDWAEDVVGPARAAGLPSPRLEFLRSPYRQFFRPFAEFLDRVEAEHPDRKVMVLVPEVIKRRWWQFALQNYRAEWLRAALLRRPDSRLAVTSVPWHLEPAATEPARPATEG